ncbi:hypothetical protein ACFQVD_39715 [Streptosporangium amethystogenes subsp. fukuiense]|uniref:DUF2384 domain-containing protein n=1 Tax=Streptosporangium amethystogenes subsp. fukuiense TaxID=698418 RepID=A0ABW2TD84_9ACTN
MANAAPGLADRGTSPFTAGTGYEPDPIAQRLSQVFLTGTGACELGDTSVRLVVRGTIEAANATLLSALMNVVMAHARSGHAARLPEALSSWAALLGQLDDLRLVAAGEVLELEEIRATTTTAATAQTPDFPQVTRSPEREPALLAREVREMSGLGARLLGAALGVTREQYSRWANGHPISDVRLGQLRFLHTLVRDLVRRLGPDGARAWLHTPLNGARTPVDLLTSRRFDLLHRAIVAVEDPRPVAEGVFVALAVADETELPGDDVDDDDEPWSPYSLPEVADMRERDADQTP